MRFLTETAKIFLVSADEIARNALEDATAAIEKCLNAQLEWYGSANKTVFIFIQEPPHRWGATVNVRMAALKDKFPQFIIHDMILPPATFIELDKKYEKPLEPEWLREVKDHRKTNS